MNEPFQRTHLTDNPGIIGARWWQESLAIAGDPVARRQALQGLAIVGASLLGVGVIGSLACRSASGDDDSRVEKRDALAMQRDYGWSFGAEADPLTFDGQSQAPFNRAALDTLVADLTPPTAALRPYYVPTLLQAPPAMPRLTVQGSTTPVKPLREVLTPINTPAMREAYRQGKALASLFEGTPTDRLVIVDMDGPLSVAFAAGAASVFEPVFVLDNWPHPLGVVPSHLTLAAVAYYQPLFVKARAARRSAYPLLVLDRARVAPYSSEATQFDNRYVARLPSAANLKTLGVKRVLNVNPSASYPNETDDLNTDLLEYTRSGVEVRGAAATDFRPDPATPPTPPAGQPAPATPDDWPPYFYGGDAGSHYWFWNDYKWNAPQKPAKKAPSGVSGLATSYAPTPRTTLYSGTGTGTAKTRPAGMGAMPVLVAAATGLVVGAAVSRSGSYNRYGSSSWGGG